MHKFKHSDFTEEECALIEDILNGLIPKEKVIDPWELIERYVNRKRFWQTEDPEYVKTLTHLAMLEH